MIQMLYLPKPQLWTLYWGQIFQHRSFEKQSFSLSLRPLRHPGNQHVSFGKTSYMLWFDHRETVGLLYNMGTTKYVWHSGGLLIFLMCPSLALNSLCILIWPQTQWCSCVSVSGGAGITVLCHWWGFLEGCCSEWMGCLCLWDEYYYSKWKFQMI